MHDVMFDHTIKLLTLCLKIITEHNYTCHCLEHTHVQQADQ
jgi:hypothetical protein